jgi:hypothetical protein
VLSELGEPQISGLLTDIDSAEEFLATVEMLKQRLPKAPRRNDDEAPTEAA